MKILLAADGSKFTKKMLAYLATHDEMFGGGHEFTVFTALTPLPPRAGLALGKKVVDDYHAETAGKVLAPILKFMGRHGMEARSAYKVGPTGETIAKFADSGKFDLVVMGSHGWGALGSLVLGSVATQVLARSKVPVLLVR
ncbi:universal stress protein [Variovorax sp. VNK109]|jgi:nucleotide-binding universal stress UspA family protein|uniref:universal stress protein n=1 Tax=Variovorax sp. VNK109 TaxID=3400919 RepID=UPI003C0A43F3